MLNLPDASDRDADLISPSVIPNDRAIKCRKTECFRVETKDRDIVLTIQLEKRFFPT